MSKKLNELLNKLGAEVLSEDAKQALIKEFETLIAEKAQIHVKAAVDKLDNEHSQILEKVLANIDADHAQKFKIAMERVDKSYAHKLKLCQERFNKCIRKDAKAFKAKLTSALSQYLEQALPSYIPNKVIAESVTNQRTLKMLNEMRAILGVDLAFSNAQTAHTFKSQRKQINEARKQNARLVKKFKTLNEKVRKANTGLLIEKVVDQLQDPEERAFMRRRMANKPLEYVKENFDYVLKVFRNDRHSIQESARETAKRKVLTEKAKKDGFIKRIPQRKPAIINEAKDPVMDSYLAALND